MAVHTQLKKKDIINILSNYNLGELIRFSGIKDGIENTNYKIETNTNKYILTIFEKRVKKSNLPLFLKLMKLSNENGIKCPQPIFDKKGNLINQIKSKSFSFFTFLDGQSKKKWSSKTCFNLGKTLAEFHQANQKINFNIKNDFGLLYWESLFIEIKKKINKNESSLINKEINFLKNSWPKDLPRGVIHADLFPDNIFFKNSSISGILDFYFSCYDFLIYDLAIVINAWCFIRGNFEKKNFHNIIAGYQSIRNLEKKEKDAFNIMLRGASMRFLLTRLFDKLNKQNDKLVEKKNPQEFLDILKFHIQNITEFKNEQQL